MARLPKFLSKFLVGTLLGATVSSAVIAEDSAPVVVELFTSQGCSSCPPADAMLVELAQRDDIIALAYHVDIWDYIGWVDTLAKPEFTARQKAYAHSSGRGMIYTPQIIVDGGADVMGAKPMQLAELVMHSRSVAPLAEISVAQDGASLSVSVNALSVDATDVLPRLADTFDVVVVRFTPYQEVNILRGENAGKSVGYANTVTEVTRIGGWNLQRSAEFATQISGSDRTVVLVQEERVGRIIAAALVP